MGFLSTAFTRQRRAPHLAAHCSLVFTLSDSVTTGTHRTAGRCLRTFACCLRPCAQRAGFAASLANGISASASQCTHPLREASTRSSVTSTGGRITVHTCSLLPTRLARLAAATTLCDRTRLGLVLHRSVLISVKHTASIFSATSRCASYELTSSAGSLCTCCLPRSMCTTRILLAILPRKARSLASGVHTWPWSMSWTSWYRTSSARSRVGMACGSGL
mmetsp:Transcript_51684/g.135891  ORF Transcript_51684/g.135891 Transcript_51684/m.135891 type:complete len:219 (+) Transcript_51684:246-902(+)